VIREVLKIIAPLSTKERGFALFEPVVEDWLARDLAFFRCYCKILSAPLPDNLISP
jgi:hypothetical protein